MGKVFTFIPAYNEEGYIGKTINTIKSSVSADKIVVVDDGSTDNTKVISESLGVYVVSNQKNLGKGRALKKALFEEFKNNFHDDDIVLLADADLGESAAELRKLIEPILKNEADLTIAIFPPAKVKGGFGLVKKLSAFILSKICRRHFKAPLSGQRAFRAFLLRRIEPAFKYGFGLEVAMTICAFKSGARIKEVETLLSHRETGKSLSDFLHRGRQFLSVLKVGIDSFMGRL